MALASQGKIHLLCRWILGFCCMGSTPKIHLLCRWI